MQGGPDRSIDPSLLTFINHGCNSKYNIGKLQSINELTASEDNFPEAASEFSWQNSAYNPFVARNVRILMNSHDYANRDIKAGEEITDNYLIYADTPEQWKRTVADLRGLCQNEGVEYAAEE